MMTSEAHEAREAVRQRVADLERQLATAAKYTDSIRANFDTRLAAERAKGELTIAAYEQERTRADAAEAACAQYRAALEGIAREDGTPYGREAAEALAATPHGSGWVSPEEHAKVKDDLQCAKDALEFMKGSEEVDKFLNGEFAKLQADLARVEAAKVSCEATIAELKRRMETVWEDRPVGATTIPIEQFAELIRYERSLDEGRGALQLKGWVSPEEAKKLRREVAYRIEAWEGADKHRNQLQAELAAKDARIARLEDDCRHLAAELAKGAKP